MKVDRTQRGGDQYLALQALARATAQVFDQVAMLYGIEGFLRRLAASDDREAFVLKGGVLLAAYDARRPTRDAPIDGDVYGMRMTLIPAGACTYVSSGNTLYPIGSSHPTPWGSGLDSRGERLRCASAARPAALLGFV